MPDNNTHPAVNYAAIVAAADAENANETLIAIVNRNLLHFRGFAQAGAKQKTALAFVCDLEKCNYESLRRTFLEVHGGWKTFRRVVTVNAATSPEASVSAGPPTSNSLTPSERLWG